MDPKQSLSLILFNLVVTFADATAVVGLITHGDKAWCGGVETAASSSVPRIPRTYSSCLSSLPSTSAVAMVPYISLTTYTEHTNTTAVCKHLWLHADVLGTADLLPHWGMEAAHWQRRRLCGGGRRVAMQPCSGGLCVGKRSRETRLKFGSLSLVDLRCTRTTVSLPTPDQAAPVAPFFLLTIFLPQTLYKGWMTIQRGFGTDTEVQGNAPRPSFW